MVDNSRRAGFLLLVFNDVFFLVLHLAARSANAHASGAPSRLLTADIGHIDRRRNSLLFSQPAVGTALGI